MMGEIYVHIESGQQYMVKGECEMKNFSDVVESIKDIVSEDHPGKKIFDKDVNLFSMGPESYISLGNEKYSIIDITENEEETVDSNNAN